MYLFRCFCPGCQTNSESIKNFFKGWFIKKWKCIKYKMYLKMKNHLLTLMSFQTCMTFFFSAEHKRRYFEEYSFFDNASQWELKWFSYQHSKSNQTMAKSLWTLTSSTLPLWTVTVWSTLQSSEHQNDQTQEQFLPPSNPSHEHLTLNVEHTTLLYNYLFTTHTGASQ